MAQVSFFCTECSGEIFESSLIPNGANSFTGAICAGCGHVVTGEESARFAADSPEGITAEAESDARPGHQKQP